MTPNLIPPILSILIMLSLVDSNSISIFQASYDGT